MKLRSTSILIVFLILCLFVTTTFGQKRSSITLRWPPDSQQAHIEFLYSFSGKDDLGIEKSWWKKAIEYIFGDDEVEVHMVRPQAIALSNDGSIYVTDPPSRRVHIFNFTKKEYREIVSSKQFQLVSPVGIAVGTDNRVYIVDSEARKVYVLDGDDDFLFSFNIPFDRPTGISLNGEYVYVVDTGTHSVVVCTREGNEVRRFGHRGVMPGEFNYPVAVCSDRLKHDQLYVVDALNFRLQILKTSGEYSQEFGRMGDAPGDFGRPKGIATDNDGHIYITDALYDITQIFDASGRLLLAFGGSGNTFGKFSIPSGITIDADNKIYVVDSGNQRVQVFQYLK